MGDVEFALEEVDGQIRRKRAPGKTPPKADTPAKAKKGATVAGKSTKAVSSKPKPKTRKERLAARAGRYAKLNELKKKQRAAKKPGGKKAATAFKAGVAKSRATAEKQREFHEKLEKRDEYYGPTRALNQVKGAAGTVGEAARDLAWASRLAGFDETGKAIGKLGLLAGTIGSVASTASAQAKRLADRQFDKDKGRYDPEMEPTWYEWATGTKSAKQQMMDDLAAARAIGSGAKLATPRGGDSEVSSKKMRVAGKSGRPRLSKKLVAKAEAQTKQAAAVQTAYAIAPDRDPNVRQAKRYAKEVRRARAKRTTLNTKYPHQTVDPTRPSESTVLPAGTEYDLDTEWGRNVHKMEQQSIKDQGDLPFERMMAKSASEAEKLRQLIRKIVREQDLKDAAKDRGADVKRPTGSRSDVAAGRDSDVTAGRGRRADADATPALEGSSSAPSYAPAIAEGTRRGIESAAVNAGYNSLRAIYGALPPGTSSVSSGAAALPMLAAGYGMYNQMAPRAQFNPGLGRHDPTPFAYDP